MSIVERAVRKLRQQSQPSRERETQSSEPEGLQRIAPESAPLVRAEEPAPVNETVHRRGFERPSVVDGEAPALPRLEIDHARLLEYGLAPPEEYAERLATEYQTIKRPLLSRLSQLEESEDPRESRYANRIVVSSAVPGEGKTFTAINLALSLARERDYRVVLIDGDILKPRASEALGLRDEPGFGDLLADESLSVHSALFETDYHGMWVMPAGRRDPLLAEHLSSRRADQILTHLQRMREATILVMDSPPLLPTSEAALLAGRSRQVVMVVKAGATAQHTLRHAIACLREDHEVNLLLNQAQLPRWQDYYGQY